MSNLFFDQPILNSPYEYPGRHWELDANGQPTQRIIESRRKAEFITPIPKPRKVKGKKAQAEMHFEDMFGGAAERQKYDPTPIINELRRHVDAWRGHRTLPKSGFAGASSGAWPNGRRQFTSTSITAMPTPNCINGPPHPRPS